MAARRSGSVCWCGPRQGKITEMAVTEERTASPARAELFDVFVGLLSEIDAKRDGSRSNAFHDRLCEAVCRLTSMERAVLFLHDPADRRTGVAGAHGVERERLSDLHVTLDDAPMARQALVEDRVVVASERIEDKVTPEYARLFGLTTLTCTPVAAAGQWLGVLFADRGGGRFRLTDDERYAMWTLGKTAALAASAWVVTREHEYARRLSERLSLAREIHDHVVQRLFGVSLVLGSDGPLSATARERCRDELHGALTELRSALRRPLALEPPSPDGSLQTDLEDLAERRRPPIAVRWQPGLAVPASLDRLARAVLAEAIRNTSRHADPDVVEVTVERHEDDFVLTVRNDGVRDKATPAGPGMGLRLVALEAMAQGGRIDAGAHEPGHWQVRLTVPLERGNE
jgi:signal transduction histidine kinase